MLVTAAGPNAPASIDERVRSGQVTWRWPLILAFVRLVLIAVGVGIVAVVLALLGVRDPVLLGLTTTPALMLAVNLASLLLLRGLTRREQIRLRDLIGLDRTRLGRDAALGLLWLVVLNIPFLGAVVLMTVVVARPGDAAALPLAFEQVFTDGAAQAYAQLDLPLLWAVVVGGSFALLNPVVEEMHYRGYVQPRLVALSGSAPVGISLTAIGFAVQHLAYAFSLQAAAVYVVAFAVWGTGAGLIYHWQCRLPSLILTHLVVNASFGALPIVLAVVDARG